MERIYFHSNNSDEKSSVEDRDDRAKYAYQYGIVRIRGILNRLCPVLPEGEADWLYDQMLEAHLALYSATLFEVHLASADCTSDNDDLYSNGWPVVRRVQRPSEKDCHDSGHAHVGEELANCYDLVLSPPQYANACPEHVAEVADSQNPAPSDAWKSLTDMHLMGIVEYRRDETGRTVKTVGEDSKLHPVWVLTELGAEFYADRNGSAEN
jgi:hypothetical protein